MPSIPRITTLGNVEIRVYPDDTRKHRQPHFHAVSPDADAVLSLPDLTLLAGSLRDLNAVLEWAAITPNRDRLMDAWDLGNPTLKVRRPPA